MGRLGDNANIPAVLENIHWGTNTIGPSALLLQRVANGDRKDDNSGTKSYNARGKHATRRLIAAGSTASLQHSNMHVSTTITRVG